MAKVKVATAWLDCCSGCHMSFLDLDEALIGLADVIEITASPITDIKEFSPVDVGIIEGAVGNAHDEEVARNLRANCKILMVWGDCACFGGIVSMRNLFSTEEILHRYYSTESTAKDSNIPSSEDLPPLTEVRPVNQVVKVDCYVPGCPPSSKAIHYALAELLEGRIPILPSEMMRFD
ncbi:NAD-reducing hydrogenase HoxS subunit delta [subsurface metagenome]